MIVDFFNSSYKRENCSEYVFGICDDDQMPLECVYISTDISLERKWDAKVRNERTVNIIFLPVDKNIPMIREDGNEENRCDAILFPEFENQKDIIFVELKNEERNWITSAIDQVETTVKIFKENHNIGDYKNKLAYVANRRHPFFRYSLKDKMQNFYNRNKVRLKIQAEISI